MVDGFDYQEFLTRRAVEMASQFANPDVNAFLDAYRCDVPPGLKRLYDLGKALLNAPIEVDTSRGPIVVQSFCPMATEVVQGGARYNWQFYEFAVGDEAESLLFSLGDSNSVFVDHSGDGADIEDTSVDFDLFVASLRAILNSASE